MKRRTLTPISPSRATGSATGLTGATRVTINVTDVSENRAPVFTDGSSTTRSIAENTAGENIGTARGCDGCG